MNFNTNFNLHLSTEIMSLFYCVVYHRLYLLYFKPHCLLFYQLFYRYVKISESSNIG